MPTTNGKEQVFNFGIKNNDSRPADTSAEFLVTQSSDGTQGKILYSSKQDTQGWVVNSQTFNTESPDVTNTGSSFGYSENGLVVSGGDGSFNNHSNLLNYTLLEDHQIELGDFTNTVEGAGIGVGIDCAFSEHAICKVDLSAGANRGKIYISRNKSTFTIVSATGLTFSNTDLLRIIFRRSKYSVYVYFKNVTTGAQVSTFFDITSTALLAGAGPNVNRTGTPAIWAFGGTQTFSNSGSFKYKSYSVRNPKLAIIGTSIEVGYAPGIAENRWSNLNGENKFPVVLLASASAKTSDIINALPEIEKINPEYASFNLGVNDSSTAYATVIANFRTINDFCIERGIKTIWCLATPKTDPIQNANITAFNTFISGTLTNEGIAKVVDFNTLLTAGGILNPDYSVDGVHLNPAANATMARYYIDNTKDIFAYDDVRSNLKIGTSNGTNTSPIMTTNIQSKFTPSGFNSFSIGNNVSVNDSGVYTRYNTAFGAVKEVSSASSTAGSNSKKLSFINPSGTEIQAISSVLNSGGTAVNNGFGLTSPDTDIHLRAVTGLKIDSASDTSSTFTIAPVSSGRYATTLVAPGTNDALMDFNPNPSDNTKKAAVRFFRTTNTTGIARIEIMQGNNSGNANSGLAGNGETYLNALTGNVAIGFTGATYKLHVVNGSFSAYDTTNGGIQVGAASGFFKMYTGVNGILIGNNINSGNLFEIKNNGVVSVFTAPATSAGGYELLTRNTSTGAIEKISSSLIRPYKSFTGVFTQTGTSAPTVTALENQVNTTGVWSRTGPGAYQISLSVPIDISKCVSPQHSTVCTREFIGGKYQLYARALSSTILQVLVKSEDGSTDVDDMLLNKTIEFRVYN